MKNEILSSGIADAADNSHVPTATADSVTFTPQLQMPAMTVPTSTASAYVVPSTTAGAYVTPCNIPFISTGIYILLLILYVYYNIASYINCMDICMQVPILFWNQQVQWFQEGVFQQVLHWCQKVPHWYQQLQVAM